jgi:hypothetical protein
MITIPAVTDPISGALTPALPIPEEAIAVVCNGATYTVYEPGDTVPTQDQ